MSPNVTIGVSMPKVGLTGVDQIAFQALASKLQGAIAKQSARNLWGSVRNLAIELQSSHEGDALLSAWDKMLESCTTALRGKAVAEALAKAGYGDLSQFSLTEDGKQMAPKAALERAQRFYGERFQAERTIKAAITTMTQYFSNVRRAFDLGVDVSQNDAYTVGGLVKLNKDAADAADPVLAEQRKIANNASELASELAGAFKADAEAIDTDGKVQTKLIGRASLIACFSNIVRCWNDAGEDLQNLALDNMAELAEQFHDAFAKAEQARQQAAIEAEGGKPRNTSEQGDEAVHAKDESLDTESLENPQPAQVAQAA